MALAEEGVDDPAVAHDLVRRAFRKDLAEIENGDAIGDVANEVDVVAHQHDGELLYGAQVTEQSHHALDFIPRQPCGRFV
jgi:hypothetical protein